MTLERRVVRTGVGIHSGVEAAVTLEPAPSGSGIVFVTREGEVPATPEHASAGEGATVLSAGDAHVLTPEHLLAALAALGVTDVRVVLDGPELPALDGSAAEWVSAIDEAGRVGPPPAPWVPRTRIEVAGHGGSAVMAEGESSLTVHVDFGAGGPSGSFTTALTEAAFREDVCWARTFVLARDVDRLRAAGRGRGASADNTVVWPTAPLRSPDEPVRHKALDAWGDLALLGPLRSRVEITRGSHALHLALVHEAHRTR